MDRNLRSVDSITLNNGNLSSKLLEKDMIWDSWKAKFETHAKLLEES
jgi:hypothetical protein